VSFLISRTVGLPAIKPEDWSAFGIVSVVIEAAFVALALAALARPNAMAMGTASRV